MDFKYQLRKHFTTLETLDYVSEEKQTNIPDGQTRIDCSFGVSPFGYSEQIDKNRLIEKVDIQHYPPFPYDELKDTIIKFWKKEQKLTRAHIHVCSGTMLILDSINSLFLDQGDKVLGYSPQFSEYVNSVRIHGGIYESVPLKATKNYQFCAEDIVKQLNDSAYKLVYIDNPNNPTGQIIPIEEIEHVVFEAEKRNVCVIIDEAYGEYMPKENSAMKLLSHYDNVYITRSFSKGYALASLRIGYVVASEELSSYYSIIDDLLLNPIGLEAAKISLQDELFLQETILKTSVVKETLLQGLHKFTVLATNSEVPIFVLKHPDSSVNLVELLLSEGVIATSGFIDLGQNAVRMRIPKESKQLAEVLQSIERTI